LERETPLSIAGYGARARLCFTFAVAVAAALCPVAIRAQQVGSPGDADGGAARPRPTLEPGVPTGEIRIDGKLDEPSWRDAPFGTDFVQAEPLEGQPATLRTEVRVLIDDEAIYIAGRMFDPDPDGIARQLVRRDDRGPYFDWFGVFIDPNFDRRTGYGFQVNASGVQADKYMFDDFSEDVTWDAVWASAVQLDSLGWVAEFRIPLSQIRYTSGEGPRTWGINFTRRQVARAEVSHFALYVRQRAQEEGNVSRFATLENVIVPKSVPRIEARPYALSSFHQGPFDVGDPFFDGTATASRFGSDFRLGLGSAYTLDATIRPDFGQVEADPAEINLTAFETFFDEQRPFFVEDAQIFNFGLSGGRNQLFYSRRIGRSPHGEAPDGAAFGESPDAATILGAAKLTGRSVGGLSLGFLSALTQAETGRAQVAGDIVEFDAEPRTGYAAATAQQDLNGGASQVGLVATALQRALPNAGTLDFLTDQAYSAGVRFDHQWNDRGWRLSGFLAGSYVRGTPEALVAIQRSSNHYFQRPDATRSQVDSTATSLGGAEWRLQLDRQNTRHWTGSVWAAEVTKGFEINDVGFSTNRERLDGGTRIGYREIRPGKVFRNYSVQLQTIVNFSHEALDDAGTWSSWRRSYTGGNFNLNARGTFLSFHEANIGLSWQPDLYSRTATRGGPVMVEPGSMGLSLGFNSDRRQTLSGTLGADYGRATLGDGSSVSVNGSLNARPTERILLDLRPRFSVQSQGAQYVTSTSAVPYAPTFDRRYLFGALDRTTLSVQVRVSYIVSPKLSFQVFAQPLLSSGDYVDYKQLAQAGTYEFLPFSPGQVAQGAGGLQCTGGDICRDVDGVQHVDFDGDGSPDLSFTDRDFNVRSLIGNAVLRWEYRPGSTVFLVWQRQQQRSAATGDFAFGRDLGEMWGAPADNRFILKVSYWLGL